jgi:hypothetical protein
MREYELNTQSIVGCIGLLLLPVAATALVMFLWALLFGLKVGDSKWELDLFPPRVYDSYSSAWEE